MNIVVSQKMMSSDAVHVLCSGTERWKWALGQIHSS